MEIFCNFGLITHAQKALGVLKGCNNPGILNMESFASFPPKIGVLAFLESLNLTNVQQHDRYAAKLTKGRHLIILITGKMSCYQHNTILGETHTRGNESSKHDILLQQHIGVASRDVEVKAGVIQAR